MLLRLMTDDNDVIGYIDTTALKTGENVWIEAVDSTDDDATSTMIGSLFFSATEGRATVSLGRSVHGVDTDSWLEQGTIPLDSGPGAEYYIKPSDVLTALHTGAPRCIGPYECYEAAAEDAARFTSRLGLTTAVSVVNGWDLPADAHITTDLPWKDQS